MKSVFEQVLKIFRNVLDDPELELAANMVADDVDDWDSLTHIQIIVATEKLFKIKFTALEIREFKDIGHFCSEIQRKLDESWK